MAKSQLLTLVCIVLLGATIPQTTLGASQVTFGSGARIDADAVEVNASWFLAFGPGSSAWSATVPFEASDSWRRITNHQVWSDTDPVALEPDTGEVWGNRHHFEEVGELRISSQSENSSIFMLADSVLVDLAHTSALIVADEHECPSAFLRGNCIAGARADACPT